MAMDFASLGIRIDTSGVEKSKSDLDQLTGAAQRAEQAAEGVGPAYQSVARHVQSAAAASRNAAPPIIQQSQSMQAATLSAKQYSQALRMVPAQITDIVTGLVSGQPAYMVAIQQGGQLRDSFGGVSTVNVAAGTPPAQVDAILQQRNAELKLEIFENLQRHRWPI
jgi:phage-related minor tail protein